MTDPIEEVLNAIPEPHTVAWTVDHVETVPLEQAAHSAAVNHLATLVNSWNEHQGNK
ncbi:hypothetical protein ACFFQW_45240 [Umezawaea endophytica]|uniref:Uncharacterized protein n=1 Tax=Umezawaea endophytica TaxID=1654476 RepID=A0A9X2VZI8_9PSEU|nr:hypothetical protein [Umezawaea endophytica]MCS7484643.1 hypothetical protein [Umezawaea endophytica]